MLGACPDILREGLYNRDDVMAGGSKSRPIPRPDKKLSSNARWLNHGQDLLSCSPLEDKGIYTWSPEARLGRLLPGRGCVLGTEVYRHDPAAGQSTDALTMHALFLSMRAAGCGWTTWRCDSTLVQPGEY